MPKPNLIYSMSVSLDGYIKGPDGTFDWAGPSAGEHRLPHEHVGELSAPPRGRAFHDHRGFYV